MTLLRFQILDARPEKHAAVPTLLFRLRVEEAGGQQVQAIALRCQIQIDARRRSYSAEEKDRLFGMFGEAERWGQTLRSIPWTNTLLMVPEFERSVEVDLPVPCTYDLEVSCAKYFHALEGGEIPLTFLFSGTVFAKGDNGLQIAQVPWDREAGYRLPVRVWRELMDAYYPGGGWIRLRRESLDALERFRSRRALMTWDDAIDALIESSETVRRQEAMKRQ